MVQIRKVQSGKTTALVAVLAIGTSTALSLGSPTGISAAPGRGARGPAPAASPQATGKPERGGRPAPDGTPRPAGAPQPAATPGSGGSGGSGGRGDTPRRTPQPQSTPSARPTPAPRPTPASRPTPVPGERDIALFEGALDRTLTDTEKSAISAAATKRDAAIKSIIRDFENEVAAIFGLTATQLQSKLKTCRPGPQEDLASLLATALGRELTDEEKSTLNAMIVARDTALGEAMATFHESAAAALGLSPEELDAKIRAYLSARRNN